MLLALAAAGGGIYFATTKFNESAAKGSTKASVDAVLPAPVTEIATTAVNEVAVLPDIAYVRPSYRVATFVETSRQVGYKDGAPAQQNMVITSEVDYVTPIASLVFDVRVGTTTKTAQIIMTDEYNYRPSDTFGAPWERTLREPSAVAMDTVGHLRMYQDVVSAEVREAASGLTATDELVHGIPVTTYRFNLPWTKLPGFDGITDTAAAMVKDALLDVQVTLSVDADGLLRVTDYQFDEQAWTDAASVTPDRFDWFVHTRLEITSTSNDPSAVVPPAEFVDLATG